MCALSPVVSSPVSYSRGPGFNSRPSTHNSSLILYELEDDCLLGFSAV
jgi:hypothetical protein